MRYSLSHFVFLLSFLVSSDVVCGQDSIPRPSMQSTKITDPPKIDGLLNDIAWQNAPIATLNITWLPEYGKIPTHRTEVKVVYDNNAIYIAAMCFDSVRANINTQLSERDGQSNADNFTVAFDTYDDDLNGYRFTVTAAGVQKDQRISLNSNNDLSWDAVWESEVSINEQGWICEIKIPYSALRFPTNPIQNWGLQFNRTVNKTGEYILWSPVDPKIFGVINQWGSYIGMQDITPPIRLSFSPYINAGNQWTPISYEPVEYDNQRILNGGLDVKYGINESFTLDATLILNFGEVQSDNVILNLSPFEQQFDERRPFFTEGTEIFNQTFSFLGDKLFYSRRIGGTPQGYYDVPYLLNDNEEILSNPYETSLYNATKFSGRTDKNLGIGIFNAIAAPEVAVIKDTITGINRNIETSPLTNYNMIVFEQSLKNNSKVSFTNTNTIRDGIFRDANVTQFLYDLTNKSHKWNAWGFANVSQVFEPAYKDGTDELITENKNGYNYIFGVSQFTGKWNFNFSHALVSKNYDHTDMGIQYGDNYINNYFGFNYNNQEPKKGVFYNYNSNGGITYNLRAEPLQYQEVSGNIGFNGQFKNFWNAGFNFFTKPLWFYDFYEPRVEGAKYHHAPFSFVNFWGGSDYRKDISFNWNVSLGESPLPEDPYIGGGQYITWHVNNRFSIDHGINLSKDHNNYGFVDFYGDDIIFGRRNVTSVDHQLSFKFIFGPKMNIIARAREYWGKVVYFEYYTLLNSGDFGPTEYTGGNDINFNIFNVDFVYAWEFAPGSYLNIIWKNNIFQTDGISEDAYLANCKKTFQTPQSNGVSLKLVYYLDYQNLKKKQV